MVTTGLFQVCDLFRGVDDEKLQLLCTFCKEVAVEQGAALLVEGQPAKTLYAIRQGRVALEMTVPKPEGGRTKRMVVTILGPSDVFGWSALVEPYILTLSARALEPCSLVAIEGRALREGLGHHLDLGFLIMSNLTQLLAKRLDQTRQALLYERGWAMVG